MDKQEMNNEINLTPTVTISGFAHSGKTVIAELIAKTLREHGFTVDVIDAERNVEEGLSHPVEDIVQRLRDEKHRLFDNPVKITEVSSGRMKHSSK